MSKQPAPLILIVDDNPANLQFLGKLLADLGYELGLAQNGTEALEFAGKQKPDLILLDIMLPGIDGYEVCKQLKENPGTAHIPIIFLTAKTDEDSILKGFEVGCVDYVTKPFKGPELLARVKVHIELEILKGLLPICSNCHKIREDEGLWTRVEQYFESRSKLLFTHSICPDCITKLYGDQEWYRRGNDKKKK